jgi:hypothetical protein
VLASHSPSTPGDEVYSAKLSSRRSAARAIARALPRTRDQRGRERLGEREDPVPPGDEQLAPIVVDGGHDRFGDALGPNDQAAEDRRPENGALWKPLRLDEPRIHGVDGDAARPELGRGRARERELCVLGCRVRARRWKDHGPGHGDDVDDVGRSGCLERAEERAQAPHAAEVVRPQHLLEPVGLDFGERLPAGDACVVRQQRDSGMPRDDRVRRALDSGAVGDVTGLVLAADFVDQRAQTVAAPCQEDAVPPVARETARERLADAARGTGDDGDATQRQTRTVRSARAARPRTSRTIDDSRCLPFVARPVCQTAE